METKITITEYISQYSTILLNVVLAITSIVAIIAICKNRLSKKTFNFELFLTAIKKKAENQNLISFSFDLIFMNFTDKSLYVTKMILTYNHKDYEIFNSKANIDMQIHHKDLFANVEILPYQSVTYGVQIFTDKQTFTNKTLIKLTAITTRKKISHKYFVDFC